MARFVAGGADKEVADRLSRARELLLLLKNFASLWDLQNLSFKGGRVAGPARESCVGWRGQESGTVEEDLCSQEED